MMAGMPMQQPAMPGMQAVGMQPMAMQPGMVAGAGVMLTLEEVLRMWTEYWHLPLGLLLLCVVFGAPRGLTGLWSARGRQA